MATKNYGRLMLRGMTAGTLLLGASHLFGAAEGNSPVSVAEVIVTVQSPHDSASRRLQSDDVTVYQGRSLRRVIGFERLSGEQAAMQLFIYVDDSIGTEALQTLLPDVRNFLQTLPATTQVAVGSLRGGELQLGQSFTTDHQMVAQALRAPSAQPETSDSPYSALLYLAKRWPSEEPTGRRAVLMLTDGNDRGYGTPAENDPYVEAAQRNSQIAGIAVYSIYLRAAGLYTPSDPAMNLGQPNLQALSNATGGHFYSDGVNNPVSLKPYLKDLHQRLANQYRITFEPRNDAGGQPVSVHSELVGVGITSPTRVYARQATLAAEVSNAGFSPQQLTPNGQ